MRYLNIGAEGDIMRSYLRSLRAGRVSGSAIIFPGDLVTAVETRSLHEKAP